MRLAAAAAAAAVALLPALGAPLSAAARAPAADQIANEVAKVNRAAGRAVPLAIQVELRMGSGPGVLARGTLSAAPGAGSRLELQSPRGTWERHLRSGAQLRAVRDGRVLPRPRPFLPPFELLLAGSPEALLRGLAGLGGRPSQVGLGFEGATNCWVLGGRAPAGAASQTAALWVDTETRRLVRIDLADGTRYRLGPPKRFGRVQLPAWIEAATAGAPVARLNVLQARRLAPAAGRFDPAWLRSAPPAAD